MDGVKHIHLELDGEQIVLVVPALPAQKLVAYDVTGYCCNMTYDPYNTVILHAPERITVVPPPYRY